MKMKESEYKEFKATYGIIMENIIPDENNKLKVKPNFTKKVYYFLYLFRCLIYMIIIILFYKYPMFQLYSIIFITILSVYSYIKY
jgi:hypothetical protein